MSKELKRMNCIKVDHLSKIFGKKYVIDDVSYVFESGKIYGIVGTNGCGKSVLFKMLSGLMKPTTGKITVGSVIVGENGSMPLDVGLLIEHPGFLPSLTALENLEQLAAIKNKITKKEIEEVLNKVGLYQDKDVKVKNYSLGMLQRLGIAQALMENPKILLLDEPFNSIDVTYITQLKSILKTFKGKTTILISSHILDTLNDLCDSFILLKNGEVAKTFVNTGSIRELEEQLYD